VKRGSTKGSPVIGFVETFVAVLTSFLIPALGGLAVITTASRLMGRRIAAAFALGLYFWFFIDTIGDASLLGVDQGYTGGAFHLLLWLVFALGIGLLFGLDRDMFSSASAREGLTIPLLVAIAIGIHGIGEGAGIGATASTTPATDLLSAFGGLTAAAAFIIHKGLEPMIAGAAYVIYSNGSTRRFAQRIKDIVLIALALSVPGILGGAAGYYVVLAFPNVDFTYIFALGLGTSIYAVFRLAKSLFGTESTSSVKVALAFIAGFTCLYLAALLHS